MFTGKDCARCGAPRTLQEVEGVPTCDNCFVKLAQDREGPRMCPVCSTAMTKRVVLNVMIDTCPSCRGVWLDRNELEVVVSAVHENAEAQAAMAWLAALAVD